MIIHTVFVTYNRLHLTRQAVESFLDTVSVPYSYIVVDNASEDGTQDWLAEQKHPALLLARNFYPGYATNRGWEAEHPKNATHLHRADNDFAFLPGWCEHVEARFAEHRAVGQVGLRTAEQEAFAMFNVGGNNIIRRELWDQGLRYDERPWSEYEPGFSEDSYFTPAVKALGYRWGRVREQCLESLATGDWSDSYYRESYGVRGITPHPDDPTAQAILRGQ
jgi:glycosyltransferase involved in cell wall biosynthesis